MHIGPPPHSGVRGPAPRACLLVLVFLAISPRQRRRPSAQEPSIQPAQLPPTVMKVEIKNWHGASPDARRAAHPATYPASHRHVCVFSPTAVASWTWTSEDDVCGICHMALDGCAPGAVGPGDDSPVVWGRVRGPPPPAARLHRRPRSSRPCPHPCVWHSARTTST